MKKGYKYNYGGMPQKPTGTKQPVNLDAIIKKNMQKFQGGGQPTPWADYVANSFRPNQSVTLSPIQQKVMKTISNLPVYSPDARFADYQDALPYWQDNVAFTPVMQDKSNFGPDNSPSVGSYFSTGTPSPYADAWRSGNTYVNPSLFNKYDNEGNVVEHETFHAGFNGRDVPQWMIDNLNRSNRNPGSGEHENMINEQLVNQAIARQSVLDEFGLQDNATIPQNLSDEYLRRGMYSAMRNPNAPAYKTSVREAISGNKPGSFNNLVNYRKNGGDISLPNVYPNQMVSKYGPGGATTDGCPAWHVRVNSDCVSIYSDEYKNLYAQGLTAINGRDGKPVYLTPDIAKSVNLPNVSINAKTKTKGWNMSPMVMTPTTDMVGMGVPNIRQQIQTDLDIKAQQERDLKASMYESGRRANEANFSSSTIPTSGPEADKQEEYRRQRNREIAASDPSKYKYNYDTGDLIIIETASPSELRDASFIHTPQFSTTMGSFSGVKNFNDMTAPGGAGTIGATTMANMLPGTGQFLSGARLYDFARVPNNNQYFNPNNGTFENIMGGIGLLGDVANIYGGFKMSPQNVGNVAEDITAITGIPKRNDINVFASKQNTPYTAKPITTQAGTLAMTEEELAEAMAEIENANIPAEDLEFNYNPTEEQIQERTRLKNLFNKIDDPDAPEITEQQYRDKLRNDKLRKEAGDILRTEGQPDPSIGGWSPTNNPQTNRMIGLAQYGKPPKLTSLDFVTNEQLVNEQIFTSEFDKQIKWFMDMGYDTKAAVEKATNRTLEILKDHPDFDHQLGIERTLQRLTRGPNTYNIFSKEFRPEFLQSQKPLSNQAKSVMRANPSGAMDANFSISDPNIKVFGDRMPGFNNQNNINLSSIKYYEDLLKVAEDPADILKIKEKLGNLYQKIPNSIPEGTPYTGTKAFNTLTPNKFGGSTYEYGGPLVDFYKGKMTGPNMFEKGGLVKYQKAGQVNIDGKMYDKDSEEYRDLYNYGPNMASANGGIGYFDNAGRLVSSHTTLPEVVVFKKNKGFKDLYDNLDDDGRYALEQITKKHGSSNVFFKKPSGIYKDAVGTYNSTGNNIRIDSKYKDNPGASLGIYLSELAHKMQFDKQGAFDVRGTWLFNDLPDYIMGNSPYDNPNAMEYKAHQFYEPQLSDELDEYYNESALKNNYNKFKDGGNMITDPRGQWAHPGKNTRIPGGNITMQGVPYPVLAKASNGMSTMMYPGQDYNFPGASYVDEYPLKKKYIDLDKAQVGLQKPTTGDTIHLNQLTNQYIELFNSRGKKNSVPSKPSEYLKTMVPEYIKKGGKAYKHKKPVHRSQLRKELESIHNKEKEIQKFALEKGISPTSKKRVNQQSTYYDQNGMSTEFLETPNEGPYVDIYPTPVQTTPAVQQQNSTPVVTQPIPQGHYRVEYFDPQLNQETHRMFMTQAESDAFTKELGQRNLSGVPAVGNITQRYEQRFGGALDQYQVAGQVKTLPPIIVESKSDPRYKAYRDSLMGYNLAKAMLEEGSYKTPKGFPGLDKALDTKQLQFFLKGKPATSQKVDKDWIKIAIEKLERDKAVNLGKLKGTQSWSKVTKNEEEAAKLASQNYDKYTYKKALEHQNDVDKEITTRLGYLKKLDKLNVSPSGILNIFQDNYRDPDTSFLLYNKPKVPVKLKPEPTLKPRPFIPAVKIPMGEPGVGMQIQQRTMPKLNIPNVNMSGPYMVGYHDYNTREGIDKGFATAEERDAFVKQLSEREAGSAYGGIGDISSYYDSSKKKKQNGGLTQYQIKGEVREGNEVEKSKKAMLDFYNSRPENINNPNVSGYIDDLKFKERGPRYMNIFQRGAMGYYNPFTNVIGYNPDYPVADGYGDLQSIIEHEIGHKVYNHLNRDMRKIVKESVLPASEIRTNMLLNDDRKGRKHARYLGKKTEFYTRRNSLFDTFGFDPSQPLTREQAQSLVDLNNQINSTYTPGRDIKEARKEFSEKYPNSLPLLDKLNDSKNRGETIEFMNSIKNDPETYLRMFNDVTAIPGQQTPMARYGGGLDQYQTKGEVTYTHEPGKEGLYRLQRTVTPYTSNRDIRRYTQVPTDPRQINFIQNYAGATGSQDNSEFVYPTQVPIEGEKHWNIDRFIIDPQFSNRSITNNESLEQNRANVLADMYKYYMLQDPEHKGRAFRQAKRFVRREIDPRIKGPFLQSYNTAGTEHPDYFQGGYQGPQNFDSQNRLKDLYWRELLGSGNVTPEEIEKLKDVSFDYFKNYKGLSKKQAKEQWKKWEDEANVTKTTGNYKNGGGLLSRTVTCSNCGWSWKAVEGGEDVMTCHKCGGTARLAKAQNGFSFLPEQDPEMIYTDRFNTPLTEEEQKEFDNWVAQESKRRGRNILMDKGAYDVQGFWKSGDYTRMKDGHGFDTWKKPNHPTFSNQSIYHGVDGFYGGNWTPESGYQPSKQSAAIYGPSYYNRIFAEEPGRSEHLDASRYMSGVNRPSPLYYKQGGVASNKGYYNVGMGVPRFYGGGNTECPDGEYYDVTLGKCMPIRKSDDPDKQIYLNLGVSPNTPVDESFEQGTANAKAFLRNWYAGRTNVSRHSKEAKRRLALIDKIKIATPSKEKLDSLDATAYYSPQDETVYIDPNDPESRDTSTQVHEFGHFLRKYGLNERNYKNYFNQNDIIDKIVNSQKLKKEKLNEMIQPKTYTEVIDNLFFPDEVKVIAEIGPPNSAPYVNKHLESIDYYGGPEEINSRLLEFRRRYNIDPTKEYTPAEMKKIMDAHYKNFHGNDDEDTESNYRSGDNSINSLFEMLGDDPEKLARLNNEVVMNQKSIGADIARYGGAPRFNVGGKAEKICYDENGYRIPCVDEAVPIEYTFDKNDPNLKKHAEIKNAEKMYITAQNELQKKGVMSEDEYDSIISKYTPHYDNIEKNSVEVPSQHEVARVANRDGSVDFLQDGYDFPVEKEYRFIDPSNMHVVYGPSQSIIGFTKSNGDFYPVNNSGSGFSTKKEDLEFLKNQHALDVYLGERSLHRANTKKYGGSLLKDFYQQRVKHGGSILPKPKRF